LGFHLPASPAKGPPILNTLTDKNIVLDKEKHEYSLVTQPDLVFTSVTTFLDQFFEGFDSEKIATNLVETNPRYAGRTVESLIAEWAAIGEHGTQVHEEIDNWIKRGVPPIETKAAEGVRWLKNYQKKSDIQVRSEVIIYSTELNIAGTVDILALDKTTGVYELIDWKTSKRIDTSSYGNKTGTSSITQDVPDCNFYHYALQLSLYRYLLEEFYGININNQLIAHLQNEGARSLVAPYMRDHIVAMLNN
jgi:ATP-dependent exoDNAse (exonuclease V) beta subunit